MLVGDSDKFPVRYTKTDRYTTEPDPTCNTSFFPADLYYADLFKSDGTFDDWDRNNNGYFGELQGGRTAGTLNVDDVDLAPDIAVGRVPASTSGEVRDYVSKVIRYESVRGTSWSKSALLVATTDWIPEACQIQDYVAEHYLKDWNVHKLYAQGNHCQETPTPSPGRINIQLNQGVGFVSYVGHGSRDEWSGCYHVSDLSGLTNSDKLPVIFAVACSTSEFATLPPNGAYKDVQGTDHRGTDHGQVFHTTPPQPACLQTVYNPEGLGEQMTAKRQTGAIAYVGCVTGAQPFGSDLNKCFFEALEMDDRTLGGMWNHMVRRYYETHVPPLTIDPPDWTKVAEFHQPWKFFLFGDPSLQIGGIMARYSGGIDTYNLDLNTPNRPVNYRRVMHLKGSFGLAHLYFVPEEGQLGTNKKRPGKDTFDVYFWESAWDPIVDMLRNEKPITFWYHSDGDVAGIGTGNEPVGEEES
jgi:hypothetical protein